MLLPINPVQPSPASLYNLERLPSPGRDPALPPIYRYLGRHPLRPRNAETDASNTYIYFVDPSDEGKLAALEVS